MSNIILMIICRSVCRHGQYCFIIGDNHVGVFCDWCHPVQRRCTEIFWKSVQLYPLVIPIILICQEPIKWSLYLPYNPLESTLSRVDL